MEKLNHNNPAITDSLPQSLTLNNSDHFQGDAKAKIMLVVYEDYECEYCRKYFKELEVLYNYFKKKIYIIYRHFPHTQMHPSAFQAALVVEACALQRKFQQARELIFEYQEMLEYGLGGILHVLKEKHSISLDQLNDDLKRGDLKRKIQNDVESGKRFDVRNTPAIFVNDHRHKYERSSKFHEIKNDIIKYTLNVNLNLKNDVPFKQIYLLERYARL